jgi:hypothetical protein
MGRDGEVPPVRSLMYTLGHVKKHSRMLKGILTELGIKETAGSFVTRIQRNLQRRYQEIEGLTHSGSNGGNRVSIYNPTIDHSFG